MRGRWVRLLVWAAVAGAAVVGLGQSVDGAQVRAALHGADELWVLLAVIAFVATVFLKGVRWSALLFVHGIRPSLGELVRVQLVGQGLNTFLPLRMGEIARVQLLNRYDRALVLSTITIEKSADLLCFGVMGVALVLGTTLPPWLSERFQAFALTTATVISLLAVALAFSREARLVALGDRVTLLRPLIAPYLRFRGGWKQLTRPVDALVLVSLSAAIWLLAILTNVCLMAAFAVPISWESGTVLLVVLQIGITIVTLPATIGIFEYLCVITLGWFGVPQSVAFSIGVVLHVLVLSLSAVGVWLARPKGRQP